MTYRGSPVLSEGDWLPAGDGPACQRGHWMPDFHDGFRFTLLVGKAVGILTLDD